MAQVQVGMGVLVLSELIIGRQSIGRFIVEEYDGIMGTFVPDGLW